MHIKLNDICFAGCNDTNKLKSNMIKQNNAKLNDSFAKNTAHNERRMKINDYLCKK